MKEAKSIEKEKTQGKLEWQEPSFDVLSDPEGGAFANGTEGTFAVSS